ncbi:MAG: CYTH domain-containing protein [Bacteroidales bacterium]|nr:CYTH domain-containing protein [Bacteroidales bacterium]
MAKEIERKFLVSGEFRQDSPESYRIMQGYICSDPDRTVRVRVRGDKGFLTIKGRGSEDGLSRYEWEKEIPVTEAVELMALCGSGVIDKTRYLVPFGKHTYEVDVFHGANEGLVLAEIELSDEQEAFEMPSWLGEEVTGDVRYYNSMLSLHPFSK